MIMNRKKLIPGQNGILTAVLLGSCLMLSGCGRQEAEFVEALDQVIQAEAPEQKKDIPEQEEKPQETEIYVDVCGAVTNPGVYALEADSRVFQAIEKAGGLLEEAAGEYVNRAQALRDGQQIYIPTREEAEALTLPAEETGTYTGENSGANALSSNGTEETKVNLNTADVPALMTLNGIGESKARAILAYREEHGGFSSIEELMNVQGIKEGTFTKIKDNVVVE